MRPIRLVAPAVFILGIAALAVALLQGQATLALFIVFPAITATGGWAVLGILLMIAGFFLFFLTWTVPVAPSTARGTRSMAPPFETTSPTEPEPPAPRRWGGVVFLGPVPVVFGSDQKVTFWMLILGIVLFVALLVLTVIALRGI